MINKRNSITPSTQDPYNLNSTVKDDELKLNEVIIKELNNVHKKFNKNGFESSLSETTLGNRPMNNCQFLHHFHS